MRACEYDVEKGLQRLAGDPTGASREIRAICRVLERLASDGPKLCESLDASGLLSAAAVRAASTGRAFVLLVGHGYGRDAVPLSRYLLELFGVLRHIAGHDDIDGRAERAQQWAAGAFSRLAHEEGIDDVVADLAGLKTTRPRYVHVLSGDGTDDLTRIYAAYCRGAHPDPAELLVPGVGLDHVGVWTAATLMMILQVILAIDAGEET